MTTHSFEEDDNFSKSPEVTALMEQFYGLAFPNMIRCEFNGSRERQIAGIDRVIHLIDGGIIHVDEKIRRKEHKYYDFALEYLSNDVTGAVGWMYKDLDIDYIAYVWQARSCGYLLSWQELSRAWAIHSNKWLLSYPKKSSPNPGYKTWSVCVPKNVILQLISGIFVSVSRRVVYKFKNGEVESMSDACQLTMF